MKRVSGVLILLGCGVSHCAGPGAFLPETNGYELAAADSAPWKLVK